MAAAQDQPPATTPTQSIASRGSAEAVGGDRLGDIVVTARRREENAQTVPVSVTAFSGAALEQRNVHELQDLKRRRSEEHTSELQSLMRISYAVFCLKKKKKNKSTINTKHNKQRTTKRTNIKYHNSITLTSNLITNHKTNT